MAAASGVGLTYRDDLIERYYQHQKDRRELRRRNLQAQTNIAQFFRRHKMNPFPSDAERSQGSVREEYARLLKGIEVLAKDKEQENSRLGHNLILL